MSAWGLCNLSGSIRVDILNNSAEKLINTWQNLPPRTPQTPVVDALKGSLGR